MADEIIIETTSQEVIEVGVPGPQGATGQGVPVGGTTGQVLRKASGTNYDTEWATGGGGGGVSSWNDLDDKPATFPPSAHTHSSSAITDFSAAASAAAPVQSVAGRTGAVTLAVADVTNAVATSDSRIANIAANSITTAQGANSGGAGGTITMRGGITGVDGAGGNAGSINLQGSDDRSEGVFHGGSIDLSGFSGHGGSITSTGNSEGAGGSLTMSGNSFAGGSINTSGGASGAGGSIDTSNDGGSINTRGTGSIGFGAGGTRTTVTGTATADRSIDLPDASGTLALTTNTIASTLVDAKGDLIVGTAADTVARLPVGATNGHVLTVDSAEAGGMKWAAASGGGGGASYIDGEVATYNDLPLDGTAALNSAWLVRTASGVWPVSSKQAGIYIRTATAGSSRDADFTYAGTMPDVFSDSVFLLYDEASTTRTGQFNLGGITAGQNRVLAWPNANGTLARTEDFAAPPAIGSTTRNTGAFTTLNANNGTLTASAPVLDLSQTWNNAAVTFRGVNWSFVETAAGGGSEVFRISTGAAGTNAIFNIRRDGNATFANAVNVGTIGGSAALTMQGTSVRVGSTGFFAFTNLSGNAYGTSDVNLFRDAAATLALRDLANPQAYRIYNTTDAGLTNFERGFMRWSSNVLQIGTEAGGTGSARALALQTDGVTRISIAANGDLTFNNFAAFSNNVTISADRVLGCNQINLNTTSTALLALGTDSTIRWGASSTTAPLLKRSSTALQVRLADDSAFAPFACAGLTLNGDLTASTRNIVTDTTTGTRIGTGTTQLLGFWNATPAAQPAAVADATDAASTQARLNDLLARLRTIGIIAT